MGLQPTVRRVAFAYPTTAPGGARLLRGLVAYAEEHGPWLLTTCPPTLDAAAESAWTVADLRGWPGEGVIAAVTTAPQVRAARRLGIPVVNLSGRLRHCCLPRVMSDQYAIGRLAATHFLERGLPRLAYCGFADVHYSRQRQQGFVERASEAGVPVAVCSPKASPEAPRLWNRRMGELDAWLRELRPPVGVLAVHDYRARTIVEQCLRWGLNVPGDVAVLGVDNDPTICEACRPTLSSVSRNDWLVGYQAASLLDRLMRGQEVGQQEYLISPEGVVVRQSTQPRATDDPHVARAVDYVELHLGEVFGVEQLVKVAEISRRQLELRFQNALHCSPHQFICHARVERAKRLLGEAESAKLHSIASACGFSSGEHLRETFRRLTGLTPAEYRERTAPRA